MPKPTTPLRAAIRKAAKREPLWTGPEVDGITQSLLSRWLYCRERFRLLVVEGLKPKTTFSHRLEYGNMWHICEEALSGTIDPSPGRIKPVKPFKAEWEIPLALYVAKLQKDYPLQRAEITHWGRVCLTQFPIYLDYWRKHPDEKKIPVFRERVFAVPYKLSSGRIVRLRGKWDAVDILGSPSQPGVWIQENKTKGDIYEAGIGRQLLFDLQTMFYFVALLEASKRKPDDPGYIALQGLPIRGVRYNVVRRPLSGGKHTIKQHAPTKSKPRGESADEYYNRLSGLIAGDPEYFFMRWKVEITATDVERFKQQFLDPCLEELCDWWEWIQQAPFDPWSAERVYNPINRIHFRYPYGCYNPTLEGLSSELDEHLNSGSLTGLRRTDELFPELKVS